MPIKYGFPNNYNIYSEILIASIEKQSIKLNSKLADILA